jgi:hypothetical protein
MIALTDNKQTAMAVIAYGLVGLLMLSPSTFALGAKPPHKCPQTQVPLGGSFCVSDNSGIHSIENKVKTHVREDHSHAERFKYFT